jgi:hypothetical protein
MTPVAPVHQPRRRAVGGRLPPARSHRPRPLLRLPTRWSSGCATSRNFDAISFMPGGFLHQMDVATLIWFKVCVRPPSEVPGTACPALAAVPLSASVVGCARAADIGEAVTWQVG